MVHSEETQKLIRLGAAVELKTLEKRMGRLQKLLEVGPPARPRRRLSNAGRKAIGAAQRARWAKKKSPATHKA